MKKLFTLFSIILIFAGCRTIENYFTANCLPLLNGISGKEEKAIHIVSNLVNHETKISDLLDTKEYIEFLELVNK
jgi:hypothetical protein